MPIKARLIHIFESIRDIPYSIPLTLSEPNNSCSGKVIKLKKNLEELGYACRFRVCAFNWDNCPIPNSVLQHDHSSPSLHVYLEVKINDSWLDVDPTWDTKLKSVFKISKWNAQSSTPIAVPYCKKYNLKMSKKIMEEPQSANIDQQLKKERSFLKALNQWLADIRKEN